MRSVRMIQDESKRLLVFITKVCIQALVILMSVQVKAATVEGDISRVGDATHLEFKGLDRWNYDLKKESKNRIVLTVPAFDKKTEVALQTWTGQFIDEIQINKKGSDGRYKVTFNLEDSEVENFDYLTDDPSRLIIDFFRQVKTSENKENESEAIKRTKASTKKNKTSRVQKTDEKKESYTKYERLNNGERKPAGELDPKYDVYQGMMQKEGDYPQRGAFDGGDPDFNRFRMKDYEIKEDSIIASRQNFYIRFPMLEMPTSQLSMFLANRPEYVIKENETRENKEARLLLQLYRKKRVGLFFKTYRYFVNKYPNSKYNEIIHHLAAEIHFDRYLKDGNLQAYKQAQHIYTMLLKEFPDSPLSERTELILSYAELERGNGIATLQRFQSFLEKYPNSEYKDQVRKSLAAGFLILNKYKDALAAYTDLSKTAVDRVQGIESYFRIGDVHFKKRDYKSAIDAYESALKIYPEYESQFPNAHYNMAEAHFWLGSYKRALNHYVEFLSRFPSHSHGGYAMTRIGENLDILGADKREVMGAFLESYFRYRDNPGAKVARVRMLSQRMKGMKDKELGKALKEINEIAQKSELPRIQEFVTLMVADGFEKREEHQRAMNLLVSYYQKNPTSTDLKFFKKKILGSIAEVLRQKVVDKEFMSALEFNGKYQKTWLRNSDRIDIPYFIGEAYEQAGVYAESRDVYIQILNHLEKIKGSSEERERRVTEHVPTIDEVRLRLAKSHLELREVREAQGYLKKIDSKNLRSETDKIALVQAQADIAEERGLYGAAKTKLSILEESWKGQSKLLAPVLLRLAGLQEKSSEYVDAIQSIEKIEELKEKKELQNDDLWADTLQKKAEILEKQGKAVASVDTYLQLLKGYEDKRPLASIRYRAGRLLFDKGDIKGAEKIWEKIDPETQPMFKKLADERLKDIEWQNDYKRYINRIPAMSDQQQE